MRATNWLRKRTRRARIREQIAVYASPATITSEQAGYQVRLTLHDAANAESVHVYMSIEEAERLTVVLAHAAHDQWVHERERDALRERTRASH